MSVGKWLLIALLFGGAVRAWQLHERTVAERGLLSASDTNGFVAVAMPDGAQPDTAIILAALNCPSAQAKRADAMAAQLNRMGIPNRRANNFSVSHITREQVALIERTNVVMTGEIPIVFINGMAKANPSIEEVVAEYRRIKADN